MINKKLKGLFQLLIIGAILLFFSYIVQINLKFIESFISSGIIGMTIYVLLEISSIVIAPVTTVPLIFIASNIWGWVLTGILNVIGWVIGSMIAFFIAKKYGVDIIKKFFSIEKIYKIQNKIPKKHFFLTVVFMRMIIPADVLSYALGLFTKMSTRNYFLSAIIGIIPAAFIYAYLGAIPVEYLIIVFLIIGILIISGYITQITCKKCVDYVKNKWDSKMNN